MKATSILLPVLAQVLLTLGMFVLLLRRKTAAVAAGKTDLKKTATDNRQWPEQVVLVSNNIANQFEVPVLFYVLCLAFLALNAVTTLILGLAVGFVATRYVHAVVHVTTNYVPLRRRVFSLGVVILLVMTGLAAHSVI